MEIKHFLYRLCLSVFLAFSVAGAQAESHQLDPTGTPSSSDQSVTDVLSTIRYPLYRLSENSVDGVFKLRSVEGTSAFEFGVRKDEVVESAVLHLRFNYSPALLPVQSHIKVMLNNEVVQVIVIQKDYSSGVVAFDVPLDKRLFEQFNHLTLVLIGHYTNDHCEDPLSTTLWADVNSDSELEMNVRHIKLPDDLALLPAPFYDIHDQLAVELGFVFSANPNLETLRAAGIVSSWIGKLADWRGAHFSTHLNSLPKGNAVVMATNDSRPDSLKDYPAVNGPTIRMVTNPADGISKLLLILGRDNKDLVVLAKSLVLGRTAFTGSQMEVASLQDETLRQPYDSPRWLSSTRPMKLGEMVDSPERLQVFGHTPDPIRIYMRIAPDLFTWNSDGVPVDLKYRYTSPRDIGESRMVVSMNKELLDSFVLHTARDNDTAHLNLSIDDTSLSSVADSILIPSYKIVPRNEMDLNFGFVHVKEGYCIDTQVNLVRAMIDPDSTIDVSSFPHYMEMPNLNAFAQLGFPYTRFADLQETTIVLPEHPAISDIDVYLGLLGQMGADTGYPSTQFHLTTPSQGGALSNSDVLVIGSALHEGVLSEWSKQLPADVTSTGRTISEPKRTASLFYDWFGFDTKPDPKVASSQQLIGTGPLVTVVGFESPVTVGRSVVAISAANDQDLPLILHALDNPTLKGNIRGSVAFVHSDLVNSVLVGKTYAIGHLPLWTAIWYPIAKHPLLVMLLGLLAVVFFGFLLWKILRAMSNKEARKE